LRWIDVKDIDESFNAKLLETLYEIDNISLGGVSSKKRTESISGRLDGKSETLSAQIDTINGLAPKQVNKIIAFYSDFDNFLEKLTRRIKPSGVSVWTLGNRRVARQEIFMNKILAELSGSYDLSLLTSFSRKILNKRMPKINAYKGEANELIGTMTREHILIFIRGDGVHASTNVTI
jgi:site-specific DNA-methyltransferase (cytosine-N4-specific)